MNLISRITLVFAVTSLLIFLAGGVITFRIMKREIDFEQERFLYERLDQVRSYLERRKPEDTIRRNKLLIIPLDSNAAERAPFISDTLVEHSTLERMEPHLKMKLVERISGTYYHIELFDVIVESDDIVDGVTEALVTTYLILLVALIIIGFAASYLILKPFRNTLSFIQSFSLREQALKEIQKAPNSRLPEFNKLNAFLNEMTEKVVNDYRSLKEFSENASHELKTPLAVIQGKLEMLLNDNSLSELQIEQLTSIQYTVRRLSKLSDSLVLLTKIDNQEFSKHQKINVSTILERIIDEFRELTELKSIQLNVAIEPEVYVRSDQTLMEVMISNLLVNAIRHNFEEGEIVVTLDNNRFVMYNTGEELKINVNELFSRFKKSNQSDASLGLGLAIVKRICDFSGFDVDYQHNLKHHTISISLN